jgi:hypothetical protein
LGYQTAVFRHVADSERGANVAWARGKIGAFEANDALRRFQMPHDRAHQRGLAGAVAADQAHHRATRDMH